ncbi:MAG: transporter substrate-binding domain-containing protein [Clostridia bacterium]
MKKLLALLLATVMAFGLMACSSGTSDSTSELESVLADGKLVIGYTVYEPMNYTDEDGNFTGFDTEFALAVCEKLGVEAEFVEINWDTKVVELDAGEIDCIWNGMTISDELLETTSISYAYVKNAQVVVVKADSDITSTADLVDATITAEIGSAGEIQIEESADLSQATYIGMSKQTECLMEVAAGTSDAAVLDWTLAMATVGEGTDYSDLMMIEDLELANEEYGIAFRLESDLTEAVNEAILELVEDGTMQDLADEYGLSLAPDITG